MSTAVTPADRSGSSIAIYMEMLNRDNPEVPREKITRYQLARRHPNGGDKAEYFITRGFSPDRPEELSDALIAHVRSNPVTNQRVTAFGTTYAVDGPMTVRSRRPHDGSLWKTGPVALSLGYIAASTLPSLRHGVSSAYNGLMTSRSSIPEFSQVMLTQDIESGRFKAGNVGTIVHVYEDAKAYELEFFNLSGETIDVITVEASAVRAVDESYIANARKLAG